MQFLDFAERLLGSTVKVKTLRHFLAEEAVVSEREMAKRIRVSHAAVNRTLKEFSELNLVKAVRAGNVKIWQLNKESYAYHKLSSVDGLLKAEPLRDLKERIKSCLGFLAPIEKAVLFGSVAQGRELPDSDIDLFVLVESQQARQKIRPTLDDLSYQCLKLYGNNLSTNIFTPGELKNPKNRRFLESVGKGITILEKTGKMIGE